MECDENRSNDTKQKDDYFEPNNERNAESRKQDQTHSTCKSKIDVYQSA